MTKTIKHLPDLKNTFNITNDKGDDKTSLKMLTKITKTVKIIWKRALVVKHF